MHTRCRLNNLMIIIAKKLKTSLISDVIAAGFDEEFLNLMDCLCVLKC